MAERSQRSSTGSSSEGAVGPGGAGNLVVVSNRQPYRHEYDDDGATTVDRPAGGLRSGLDPVARRTCATWVAWGDGAADREAADADGRVAVPPESPQYTLRRVWLPDEEAAGYYRGYSNRALWPLCHSLVSRAVFDDDHWRHYRSVNERFADAAREAAAGADLVWFQDYHLALAPAMVRSSLEAPPTLAHFWHVPWPAPDVFRVCPQRRALLSGLLGNDLVGFHVPRYAANFLECVDETLPDAVVDWDEGAVAHQGRSTTVAAAPMGVDVDGTRRRSRPDGDEWETFRARHGIAPDTDVVCGVDRVDYTKGIPQRLEAVERLFERRPGLRGDVTYVQKGCASRTEIPEYRTHRSRVRSAVDRVDDRFGTDGWRPVVYLEEMLPRDRLCALYRESDVALVTPVRDGMNLVAQEYVAAQTGTPGVLVLSDLAGAAAELGDHALTVNPYATDEVAEALETALSMPAAERRVRMLNLQRRVEALDVGEWPRRVFESLDAGPTRGEAWANAAGE